MSLPRILALFSLVSMACWAQNPNMQQPDVQNGGGIPSNVPQTLQGTPVSPSPNGPIVYTPSMTLTPNGPVYGNPVIQANSTQAANAANANAGQPTDYLSPGTAESSQSLGDVAREYRAREAQKEHPAKTYTNDDLKSLSNPGKDQSLDVPPAISPDTTPTLPEQTGGNAPFLPQSDQLVASHPTEKPSAAHHRSVVEEVEQQVQEMQR